MSPSWACTPHVRFWSMNGLGGPLHIRFLVCAAQRHQVAARAFRFGVTVDQRPKLWTVARVHEMSQLVHESVFEDEGGQSHQAMRQPDRALGRRAACPAALL